MLDIQFTAALMSEPQSISGVLTIFLALAMGHVLADFPLQGRFMADTKNRHNDVSNYFKNTPPAGIWIHTLTGHCLIHGAAVWLITGSAVLASFEIALHWIIDYARCEGWTSFHTDQILHYVCKIIYAMMLYLGVSWL